MSATLSRGRKLVRVLWALSSVAVLTVGCAERSPKSDQTADSAAGDPTRAEPAAAEPTADAATRMAPAPFAASIDSVPVDSILRYARSLEFDTLRGAGDEQSVELAGRRPVRVALQPQRNSIGLDRRSLGQGRVIARLINRDDVPLPRFNLAAHDTTYWWADSVGGKWRSVYVSSRAGSKPLIRGFKIEDHESGQYQQSLSRWEVSAQGTTIPWTTCIDTGCCREN